MSKIELSETQEKIASFEKGALLVLASAGSGKTRVLTERIKRLLTKTKRQILAITFTNKAAQEIKDRLQECENIHEKLYVGTFHSFCNYVLEKHGNFAGYPQLPQVFSEKDDKLKVIEIAIIQNPLIKKIFIDKNEKERTQFKNNCLEIISKIKRNVILDNELESNGISREMILVYLNYKDIMKSLNAIDFDDLLSEVYKLFMAYPNIASLYRRNYEYICVDEAQDLNKAQYMLLRALTGDEQKNVMLVGDPKQSIFGFNDSNSKYMIENFRNDYSPEIIQLLENYRSSKHILEYANKIVPGSTEINDTVSDGLCEIHDFQTTEEEAFFVVLKIKDLLEKKDLPEVEGQVTEDRIAVIARNKYVLLPVEEELQKNNISYYYKNTIKGIVFDSTSGNIFNLALLVQINPKDALHFAELASMLSISGEKNLMELENRCSDSFYKTILYAVLSLKSDGSNFKKNLEKIILSITEDLNYSDDEKNIAFSDFSLLKESWNNYSASTSNRSIAAFHNSLALGQTITKEDKEGVILSTVHTMKGQESDIVFLVGMDDLTFPDYRAVEKGGFELEQEKNDLYVAVTRAKRYLYISYPTTRTTPWGTTRYRNRSRLLPEL
jgi:DNA helicase II / ATP-dependent DNA helicase PcrA